LPIEGVLAVVSSVARVYLFARGIENGMSLPIKRWSRSVVFFQHHYHMLGSGDWAAALSENSEAAAIKITGATAPGVRS